MHILASGPLDVILMYKQLSPSGGEDLTLNEFYYIYDANELRWEAQFAQIPWFHATWAPLQVVCRYANDIVNWPYFEHIVCK